MTWIRMPDPGLTMLGLILSSIMAFVSFVYAVHPNTKLRKRPNYGYAFGIWSMIALYFGLLVAAHVQLSEA